MDTPLHLLTDGRERIFWGYLLASAAIALVVMLAQGKPLSYQRVKVYWGSPDVKLDCGYFLLNWLIKSLLIVPFVLALNTVAIWTLDLLQIIANPMFLPWPIHTIAAIYTGLLFVAEDCSRYWLHRAMHRNRWLWSIHKVHHSAETLSPLTFYRVHPIENTLFALRHALVAGMVTGAFVFCFGSRLDLYTVFGSNLLVVCLFEFTSNLRHSHIRLGYGPWLERFLVSPAQHQIHHNHRTLNNNYGSALALWDWMFGTLRLTRDCTQEHHYGLGAGRRARYDNLLKLLVYPLQDIYRQLRKNQLRKAKIRKTLLYKTQRHTELEQRSKGKQAVSCVQN